MTVKHFIDLRSDTVTLPSPAMRQAAFDAKLGDDVYGEDPTINRLEAMAAERLGKEAGLFVPTGTMGNLVCLLSHCQRGEEAIMGHLAHTFLFEAGGSAVVGGIHPRTIPNQPDGTLRLEDIRAAVRDPQNSHFPPTRLVCLENTHNRCGGAVLSPAYMAKVRALANEFGLSVHLDGARVFNAAIALGVDPAKLTQDVDSVTFCLSKGLSAPVGSLVCGSRDFVLRARRHRKLVGGGMRQAGVLAAAGIVALTSMVDRLAVDHANAKLLAEGLARMQGIELDLDTIQSNIVIFGLAPDAITPADFVEGLAEHGIKLNAIGGRKLRAVTHYGLDEQDIRLALDAAGKVLKPKS